jgi:hypothetical protein
MLPQATIKHRLQGRLRLCISAHKGDKNYFKRVEERLGEKLAYQRILASATTGSLLIEDDNLDLDTVTAAAEAYQLFFVHKDRVTPKPFAKRIVEPLSCTNQIIKSMSDGVLDLPGMIFLTLIGTGLWELVRGNFKFPPWYTALWYAFGLFSKTLWDELNRDNS